MFNATHDVDPRVPVHGEVLPQASIVRGPHIGAVVQSGVQQHIPQVVMAQHVNAVAPVPIVHGHIVTATPIQQAPALQQY